MLKLVVLVLFGAIEFACSSSPLIWMPQKASADALYQFVVGGKAGYIDGQGTVVMNPQLKHYGTSGGGVS